MYAEIFKKLSSGGLEVPFSIHGYMAVKHAQFFLMRSDSKESKVLK